MAKKTKKEKQIEDFLAKKKTVPADKQADFNPAKKIEKNDERRIESGVIFQKKRIVPAIFVLIILSLLGTSGYFYWQYKKVMAVDALKNEAAGYVAKIGKFMILPSEETPTVATVADSGRLTSQPFFANAQNGDKVLFFAKAQKAILYRPSKNVIVEVASMAGAAPSAAAPTTPNSPNTSSMSDAPQSQNETQATTQPSQEEQNQPADATTAPKTARVVVNNGTSQNGLAKSVSGKLAAIPETNVISTGNAKGIYAKTIVIDLTGNNADVVQKISGNLSAETGSLPAGEAKPDADVLVIAGSDAINQ